MHEGSFNPLGTKQNSLIAVSLAGWLAGCTYRCFWKMSQQLLLLTTRLLFL